MMGMLQLITLGLALANMNAVAQAQSKSGSFVRKWQKNGWLIPYNQEKFGEVACILPLIAVAQPHKPTTPVRPCLDCRAANEQF